MSRREFFGFLGTAALTACAGAPPARALPQPAKPSQPGPASTHAAVEVRALAFDLFTLFDPRGVERRARAWVTEPERFAATWKTTLFGYCWLRAASQQYRDFEGLVTDSLLFAARVHGVSLSPAARRALESSFTELEPWPDTRERLEAFRARGLRLATLANFAPSMIERLLSNAGLTAYFDAAFSTDRARTYKPDPRAYALAEAGFGLPRSQIAFIAFGGWDAAGARWFGFPTFWVNRLNQPADELASAHATGPDLDAVARWLRGG